MQHLVILYLNFATSPTHIASAIGGLGTLAALLEKKNKGQLSIKRPFPKGRTRLGLGRIGNKSYNLNNKEERDEVF